VATRHSWVGAVSSGGLGSGFIGAKGRMAAWARAAREGMTRGQNWGRGCLAVAGEARRGASSARGRIMLPRGGFLRGRRDFVGQREISRVLASPHGQAARLRRSAGLPAMGQGRGRREEGGERREKVMGLVCEKQK
jgi:hypothetical protein